MNARKRGPPMIAVTLLLVLTLGIIGVGYALWSEVLTIDGTVETGNVDAEWTFVYCFDFETVKDVGTTTGWIDPIDPSILHFHIENGYPSYTGDCKAEYTYYGTIPAHVEAIKFIPGKGLTNCVVNQSPTTGSFTAVCDQLTFRWSNGLCTQMHRGDWLSSNLQVHVEQEASQSFTYEFSIEVQLYQFNESSCP